MKIALVIDDALARPDGVQEYVRAIAVYLADAGHEVHVMCSGDGGEPPRGVTAVHSLTKNMGVTFNGNSLRTPRPASRKKLRAVLDAERFDVIHVMSPHSPVFGARVVNEARALQARSVRIVGSFVILPDGNTSDAGTRLLGKLLARNLRRFDAFTALSGPAAAFAKRAFDVQCEALPASVDLKRVRAQAVAVPWASDGKGKIVISYLGRLVERKGVLEMVEALAALPYALRERVEVRIGGRGPLAKDVEAAIESHGLRDTVRMEGFIADADKPGFLASADIAVFPATGGESFGIVLIEAMAAGAGAVIAGNNPGYAWTMDDPEAMVEPRDPGAFAAVLERLISDSTARDALHKRQQQRVEAFDQGVVGARIEQLYGVH